MGYTKSCSHSPQIGYTTPYSHPLPHIPTHFHLLPATRSHFHSILTTPIHSQPTPTNSLNPHPPTYTHFLGVLRVYRLYTLTCLTYLINLRVHVLNVCTSIYNARFTNLSVLTIDAFNVSKWNQRLFLRLCHL